MTVEKMLEELERVAMSMPAPNIYTPQIMQRVIELRAALQAREGWISVKDRMPDNWERVFVHGSRDHEIAYYQIAPGGRDGKKASKWYDGDDEVFNITHWMPLPAAPAADGGE